MSVLGATKPNFQYYEFNYADLKLEGYKGDKRNSSQLMKDIISEFNTSKIKKEDKIIDRYKDRQGTERRMLVNISAPFEKGGQRVFGKIALFKNKPVFLYDGSDLVTELDKPENKDLVEITHYSITFEPTPRIMFEFNSAGPRLSDIEYYFRQIARDKHIAKSFKTILHLDLDYKTLSQKLENVFNIDVKVMSGDVQHTAELDWHKGLKQLNEATGYKDVSLKFWYSRVKEVKTGKYMKNISGLKIARNLLEWLKKKPANIQYLEDLKMSYMVSDSDEIKDLDFLSNRATSIISVPLSSHNRRQDFNYEVGMEFNNYLKTGKTTKTPKV